jgi:hypothetical protein
MHIAIIPIIGLLLIVALAWYAINQLTLPPPVRMIIIVIACVICILIVADMFGVMSLGGRVSLN